LRHDCHILSLIWRTIFREMPSRDEFRKILQRLAHDGHRGLGCGRLRGHPPPFRLFCRALSSSHPAANPPYPVDRAGKCTAFFQKAAAHSKQCIDLTQNVTSYTPQPTAHTEHHDNFAKHVIDLTPDPSLHKKAGSPQPKDPIDQSKEAIDRFENAIDQSKEAIDRFLERY
jgi:hypothetical protein